MIVSAVLVWLRQHSRAEEQRGKDFLDRAIVLTSKDANLTKAHARYLESSFVAQSKIILPVLGVNILRAPAAAAAVTAPGAVPDPASVASPTFELQLRKEEITAAAREIDGEFTLREGRQGTSP